MQRWAEIKQRTLSASLWLGLHTENKHLRENWWSHFDWHLLPPPNQVIFRFSSVQSLSHFQLFQTPWTAACQVFLSITNSWSLLKLKSTELVMPTNHLILCHPFCSRLQSFQDQGLFQWISSSHQVVRVLEFQLQHQSFQWIFKTDFL